MKKVFFTSLFAACAAMGLSSCMNGDYDANPNANNSTANPLLNNGGNGGGGGGGTGGDPTKAAYYSWSGTDPISAKIDGNVFQATSATGADLAGQTLVQGSSGSNTLNVSFPSSTGPNTILQISSTTMGTSGYFEGSTGFASGAGTGGYVYVIENDATHCKGKWFANLKDPLGSAGSRNVTEGYFNVTK